jgi:tripartite-type tricarboxylate transporter receptor subunit TctC
MSALYRPSRRVLLGAVAFAALATGSRSAFAEALPDRPIRFIVGFGAGGPTDILARVLADQLSDSLGRKVVVENRTGASGNIATQAVASAEADGTTFLIGASPLAVNHSLFPDFPVQYGRDLVAVAPLGATANVLVVHPSLGVRSPANFVQHVRAHPGALSYATLGVGSSSHLAGIAFDLRAGTQMVPVNYRANGDAMKDVLGGHVQAWFAPIPSVLEAVRTGQFVAIATTGPDRSAWLPEVPTIAESGFEGFDVRLWVGLFAPAGVPERLLQAVDEATSRIMASPHMQTTLDAQGVTPMPLSRAQFDGFVRREIERWRIVVAALKK